MAEDHEGEFYWCLKHRTVEQYEGCKAADRLGPYPTSADASAALEHVEERNEAWETDPRFNDPDEEEDDEEEKVEGAWGPFRF